MTVIHSNAQMRGIISIHEFFQEVSLAMKAGALRDDASLLAFHSVAASPYPSGLPKCSLYTGTTWPRMRWRISAGLPRALTSATLSFG